MVCFEGCDDLRELGLGGVDEEGRGYGVYDAAMLSAMSVDFIEGMLDGGFEQT